MDAVERINLRDTGYISRQRQKLVVRRAIINRHIREGVATKAERTKLPLIEAEIAKWDQLMEKAKCSN